MSNLPWRYDEPPKDGTVFLGYMDDGCYIVMWWVDCLSDDGDGNWEAEQSTIYNEPVAWCELTPPEERIVYSVTHPGTQVIP